MKRKLLSLFVLLLGGSLTAQTAGSLDLTFDPGTGTNSVVEAIAVQTDGKILIGGPFSEYNGTSINGIARLNEDGTLDNTFNPGAGVSGYVQGQQYHVYDIAIQTDGKIILVGAFNNYDNTSRERIVRINADGSLDNTFDPGNGADGTIYCVELQGDGKMVVGGALTYYNGYPNAAPFIARINTDGTQDTSFNPGAGCNSNVRSLAIQTDGKIVIGGSFTQFDGVARGQIARVNSDGSLDTSFDPGTGTGGGFPAVRSVRLQTDGKIITSGYFDSYNGTTRGKIARILSDGTLDTSFDPGTGADLNAINKVEILSDGKMILVGGYYQYDGTSRNSIARINSDGSLDNGFDPGTGCNNTGESLAIQSDGKVLIGGNYTQYDGTQRDHIARVYNSPTSGIDEMTSTASLIVSPNPSNGSFEVVGLNTGENYVVLDITGKIILSGQNNTIDLTNENNGIYFLKTEGGAVIRLVKE